MNQLSTLSVTTRLNAVVAAAIVTLTMLSGIATLAATEGAAPQWAQATSNPAA
jgi:hypothetical protein